MKQIILTIEYTGNSKLMKESYEKTPLKIECGTYQNAQSKKEYFEKNGYLMKNEKYVIKEVEY